MLTQEQNDLITRIGKGTPCGELMRHYWQPAALVDELEGERPVRPVKLLGEHLVLFKDERGDYGLIGRQCPHRGADLCYGRLEDGGLRCPFHGWHFDKTGACVEQPAEPEGSTFHSKIEHPGYPCVEKNGIIFAYMGPGEPPAFPNLDCFVAPSSHVFAFKGFMECNWLQALEVGIDPAHASFLHRYLEDEDPSDGYGKQFRDQAVDLDMPMTQLLREYTKPDIKADETDFGVRLTALRNLDNQGMHVRITNHIFPHGIVIPMSNEMTITQWHVPVDDEHCYWYAMFTSFAEPVNKPLMREQRLELYELPDYKPRLNKRNDYGYNANEQATQTYTGMGMDINVHDQWAVESPGPIQDRTNEHLGRSDVGIITYRRLLRRSIKAVQDGERPIMVLSDQEASDIKGPMAVDAVGSVDSWESAAPKRDQERRDKAPWDCPL